MLVGYKNNGFDDINIDSLTASECSDLLSKINGFTVAKPKRSIHIIGYRVHRDWLVII